MQIIGKSFILGSLFLLGSCTSKENQDQTSIIPDKSLNEVLNCGTKENLIARYGQENLVLDTQIVYQMDTLEASILYPNTVNQVQIFYRGDQIQDVKIAGEGSEWKTDSGLYLGQDLKQVQEVNKMHFTISGFDWNYGGTVVSWEGGILGGPEVSHLVKFKNQEDRNGISEEEYMEVKGEMEFDIRHETIQALNPKCVEIALYHPIVPDKMHGKEMGMKLEHRQMERK
ncbi:MAG: hypothetical protein RIR51_1743 [Bacteroidota bacterium]|jgi:hypothetical protein